MTACILAKEYGVATRIARVRDPDFSESEFLGRGKRLGIDLLINPNIVVAEEILDLVKTPAAAEVGKFAEGKVLMLGIQLPVEGADPRPAAALPQGISLHDPLPDRCRHARWEAHRAGWRDDAPGG